MSLEERQTQFIKSTVNPDVKVALGTLFRCLEPVNFLI